MGEEWSGDISQHPSLHSNLSTLLAIHSICMQTSLLLNTKWIKTKISINGETFPKPHHQNCLFRKHTKLPYAKSGHQGSCCLLRLATTHQGHHQTVASYHCQPENLELEMSGIDQWDLLHKSKHMLCHWVMAHPYCRNTLSSGLLLHNCFRIFSSTWGKRLANWLQSAQERVFTFLLGKPVFLLLPLCLFLFPQAPTSALFSAPANCTPVCCIPPCANACKRTGQN